MRTIAILIILFHHLPGHSFNYYDLRNFGIELDFSWINELNRSMALGIFIFISGFLFENNSDRIINLKEIVHVVFRKLLRILPLYWIALTLFMVIFKNFIGKTSFISTILHITGLQVIFSSKFCEPIFTLWFVGLIITYYLIFVMAFYVTNSTYEFWSFSVIMFLFMISSIFFLGIGDKRIIVYYFIFFTGVFCHRYHLFEMIRVYHIVICIVVNIISIHYFVSSLYPVISNSQVKPRVFSLIGASTLINLNLFMISFVIIVYFISRKNGKVSELKWIKNISYASYCMFLFHRPIWALVSHYTTTSYRLMNLFILIFIGIPMIYLFSYFIQKFYDYLLRQFLVKNQL
jgi:peptidoglycan/LPS O-acetylase OafA/YrhL